MRIAFIDAGVLIAAVRGAPEVVARAQEVLADPEITTEKLGAPLHRVRDIQVRTIQAG